MHFVYYIIYLVHSRWSLFSFRMRTYNRKSLTPCYSVDVNFHCKYIGCEEFLYPGKLSRCTSCFLFWQKEDCEGRKKKSIWNGKLAKTDLYEAHFVDNCIGQTQTMQVKLVICTQKLWKKFWFLQGVPANRIVLTSFFCWCSSPVFASGSAKTH